MVYVGAWRNRRRDLVTQYCYLHEVFDWRLLRLLEQYGKCFDDDWAYSVRGRSVKIVIRVPLWLNIWLERRSWQEKFKHRIRDPRQRQLE
jgi:hypothetical protein